MTNIKSCPKIYQLKVKEDYFFYIDYISYHFQKYLKNRQNYLKSYFIFYFTFFKLKMANFKPKTVYPQLGSNKLHNVLIYKQNKLIWVGLKS